MGSSRAAAKEARRGRRLAGLALLLAACGSSSAPGGQDGGPDGGGASLDALGYTNTANAMSPLGTNVEEVRDYGTEWVFLDTFKRSRAWADPMGRPFPAANLDAHGWVTSLGTAQFAQTILFAAGIKNQYPSGAYVVLYDGSGSLGYGGAAVKDMAQSAPGRDVVNIDASDPRNTGVILKINATDATSYLKNIRVIMPGGSCEKDVTVFCTDDSACSSGRCVPFEERYDTLIFHPAFLDRIKAYRAVRFMHWTIYDDLMNPGPQTWDKRPKVDDARWSIDDKGVPVEIMVALANLMSIDPWFCIPHLADDDYVKNFATYVRDRLDPARKVYVEHSNEVWNGQYAQARYARQQGLMMWPNLANMPAVAGAQYHSMHSVQIFRIFKEVFGGTDRLVRVMGSFFDSPQVGQGLLDFQGAAQETDALAVAPYFGIPPMRLGDFVGSTPQQVIADLEGTEVPGLMTHLSQNAMVAQQHHVMLVAYEGGQALLASGQFAMNMPLNDLFNAANRDPGMGDVYAQYLELWKTAGGQLFNHYTHAAPYSIFGRFGSLEYLDQPIEQAPKYRALQTFIQKTPCWWSGCR